MVKKSRKKKGDPWIYGWWGTFWVIHFLYVVARKVGKERCIYVGVCGMKNKSVFQ